MISLAKHSARLDARDSGRCAPCLDKGAGTKTGSSPAAAPDPARRPARGCRRDKPAAASRPRACETPKVPGRGAPQPGTAATVPIPGGGAGRTFSPEEAECRQRIEALLQRPAPFIASQL